MRTEALYSISKLYKLYDAFVLNLSVRSAMLWDIQYLKIV
jgi:hypothetical protein